MRILLMGNNDHMGGLIVHYITLANYLRNAGHKLFCVNVNDTGSKLFGDNIIKEIAIPYKPISIRQKLIKFILLQKAILLANIFKPDIFIAIGYGKGYTMVASGLRSSTFKFYEEVHFEPYSVDVKRKMVNCFDAVAPQTKGMEAEFKKNISSTKPVVFLPCFSKEYTTTWFKAIPSDQSPIRLAYFGRLAGNKGIREFLMATYKIFQSNDVIFDIYGKGPESEAIKQQIAILGIHNKVTLKGFYKDADFPIIISTYHGIIIPSIDTEGLPLILIEAMRFGRPVLCTTTGAMPEVGSINQKGMIISKKEPDALFNNLTLFLKAITNGEFSAEYIHNIYREHFSNSAFLKIWERMLENPVAYFVEGSV